MTRSTKIKSGPEARAAYPRLAAWWDAAKAHGTIYTRTDVSRSGMSAVVLLWTVGAMRADERPAIICAWPDSHSPAPANGDGNVIECFDACAKSIGFSLKRRAFVVGGCGFNRAFEVADRVARLFGEDSRDWQKAIRLDTLNQPE